MKRLLATAAVLIISLSVFSQATWTEKQNIKICVGSNGYGEVLPFGYNFTVASSPSPSSKFPLLIFIHGLGEQGNGNTQLFNVFKHGPLAQVKWNNYNSPFVMIAPQFLKDYWPGASNVKEVIDYVIKNYNNVDTNRIYVTGLSMGGAATLDFAQVYPSTAAAVLATCPALGANAAGAKKIATAKLPVYLTHNNADPQVSYSNSTAWLAAINSNSPAVPAKLITYQSTTHDSWTATYNTATLQFDGKNWADWMLQYSKGSVVQPPVSKPDTPSVVMITPNDTRYLTVTKGWSQTTTDIYGSGKVISGTSLQQLYNTERWGVFSYSIPLPDGEYSVKIMCVELFHNSPGKRVFNYSISGGIGPEIVANGNDIYASVGKFAAYEKTHPVSVSGGRMTIVFSATVDNATVSGIEITPKSLVVQPTTKVITISYIDTVSGATFKTIRDTVPSTVKAFIKE